MNSGFQRFQQQQRRQQQQWQRQQQAWWDRRRREQREQARRARERRGGAQWSRRRAQGEGEHTPRPLAMKPVPPLMPTFGHERAALEPPDEPLPRRFGGIAAAMALLAGAAWLLIVGAWPVSIVLVLLALLLLRRRGSGVETGAVTRPSMDPREEES